MSGLKIVRGVRRTPARVVIHGVEGIGKTTLAAQFPEAVILDTEDGTNHIDVARVTVNDWAGLEGAIHELVRDRQGFRTVVIDSIDWAERLLVDHLLRKANKRSIEDFGFGKGYTMVAEAVGKLLTACDGLIAAGLHVVLVGHTKVARTSPPDMDEGYDRFELKLTKQSGPLVKEWADCILFANYKTRIVEGTDGRSRAKGGKERVLHTERTAAWDAKNRHGLPAEIPMAIEALAPLFDGVPEPGAAKLTAAKDEPPLFDRIADYIAKAASVRTLGTIGDKVDRYVSTGELSPVQEQLLRDAITNRHDELEPQEVTDGVA
ncbi:MAG: AAA family ATPase [Planctomycetes bacterium]|nr:AAA family ATPase [Planctomycetota bacterium]